MPPVSDYARQDWGREPDSRWEWARETLFAFIVAYLFVELVLPLLDAIQ